MTVLATAAGTVFDRIGGQVGDDLRQTLRVGQGDQTVAFADDLQTQALCVRSQGCRASGVLKQTGNVGGA